MKDSIGSPSGRMRYSRKDLPPPGPLSDLSLSEKAVVTYSVIGGLISIEEVITRYETSLEEVEHWQSTIFPKAEIPKVDAQTDAILRKAIPDADLRSLRKKLSEGHPDLPWETIGKCLIVILSRFLENEDERRRNSEK